MITPVETLLLEIIRFHCLGKQLPSNINGDAGRAAEYLLESIGIEINRGAGCDILQVGWEVKTRKGTATSAQTVTPMLPEDIITKPYRLSPVYEKIKKQLRFTTDDYDVIVAIDLCDFDQPQIQDLLESAYEHARALIIANPDIGYTPYEGYWGYFERTKKGRPEYDFRVSTGDMDSFLNMTKSTFSTLIEYGNN